MKIMLYFKVMRYVWIIMAFFALFSCQRKEKKLMVGIQPYGEINPAFIDSVATAVEKVYGVDTKTLPMKPMPEQAFVHIKNPRYRADSLLVAMARSKPYYLDHVLGVTNHDLSVTKRSADGQVKKPVYKYMDWGVFGLGYVDGPSSVMSTYRLGRTCQDIFYHRLQKIAVHEMGHNLGLSHCDNSHCVMQDAAETIETIDGVEMVLCESCLRILKKSSF